MTRYDCKFGMPHDLRIIHENPQYKWEVCSRCNKKYKWNKGYKGRTDNIAYLEAHVRNFCQRNGPTKQIYHKIYKPELTTIIL